MLVASLLVIRFAVSASPLDAQGGDGEPPVETNAEAEKRASLTPDQQVEEGYKIIKDGERISKKTAGMLDQARRENDIIRATCLNTALTQINANRRTADQRQDALEAAAKSGDDGRRNHEFTVLAVLAQRFEILEQEATQCVSDALYNTGVNTTTTEIEDQTPREPAGFPEFGQPVNIPHVPPPRSRMF